MLSLEATNDDGSDSNDDGVSKADMLARLAKEEGESYRINTEWTLTVRWRTWTH